MGGGAKNPIRIFPEIFRGFFDFFSASAKKISGILLTQYIPSYKGKIEKKYNKRLATNPIKRKRSGKKVTCSHIHAYHGEKDNTQ